MNIHRVRFCALCGDPPEMILSYRLKIKFTLRKGMEMTTNYISLLGLSIAVVNSFLTLIYVLLTRNILLSAKNSVELSKNNYENNNRPFLGIIKYQITKDNKKKTFIFEPVIKNCGIIPAKEIKINFDYFYNGTTVERLQTPFYPSVLFPDSEACLSNIITTAEKYKSIMNGSSILDVFFYIQYKGVSDKIYSTQEKCKYDPIINDFIAYESTWD